MKIAVADLLPNPFRNLKRYPINQEKVEALKQSIKDTSFWDNLLVRKSPDKSGKFEIAYGHHRLAALKAARVDEIDVPTRSLDDTAMAKIMAHENMEEWGHSTAIEQETLRAIVEGYAEGRIELPPVRKGTTRGNIRVAPSFRARGDGGETSAGAEVSYTAETLTEFLGWKPYKVEATLAALALIEEDLADEDQFKNLSTKQAETVATQVRRVARETGDKRKARAIGKQLAAGMNKATRGHDASGKTRALQDVTIHNARRVTDDMMGKAGREKPKTIPPIERFVTELKLVLADLPSDKMAEKIEAVIKHREHLPARERQQFASALRGVATRFERLAAKVEG